MTVSWVFDKRHAQTFNEARKDFLNYFIPSLLERISLTTALDAGCGIGIFSDFLTTLGLKVTAFDGRSENIIEARRRYQHIEFLVQNVEGTQIEQLGIFDLVLCFGLLYHLENPFQAIRNLHALTRQVLLIETIVTPQDRPVATLVDESQGEDQGLNYVALIPSESCFIKMLYRAGFKSVYKVLDLPKHEEFQETCTRKQRRVMLIASKGDILFPSSICKVLEPQLSDIWSKPSVKLTNQFKGVLARLNMKRAQISISIYLPDPLYQALRGLKRSMGAFQRGNNNPPVNLWGDRDIEWSWVAAHIPSGKGEALDFGNGGSHLGLSAAHHGFNTTAIDLEAVQWPYTHPNLRFVQGDILKLPLPKEYFDLIINCSTVEHVGLAGRYGETKQSRDGDLEAMGRLKELLKLRGMMLLTIPIGQDSVFAPLHRVYGAERLPQLLEGFTVEEEQFWIKNGQNRWQVCDKQSALGFKAIVGSLTDPLQNAYALGCFILRRADSKE